MWECVDNPDLRLDPRTLLVNDSPEELAIATELTL